MESVDMNDAMRELLGAIAQKKGERLDWIEILSGTRLSPDTELTLKLHGTGGTQHWCIVGRNAPEHRFQLGHGDTFEVHTEHVLLWSRALPTYLLFFQGSAEPDKVSEGIQHIYRELIGKWCFARPIRWFIPGASKNYAKRIAALLQRGRGIFAAGPEPLIAACRRVLEENGLETSVVMQHSFATLPTLSVLLVGENGFIIAKSFEAERLS